MEIILIPRKQFFYNSKLASNYNNEHDLNNKTEIIYFNTSIIFLIRDRVLVFNNDPFIKFASPHVSLRK